MQRRYRYLIAIKLFYIYSIKYRIQVLNMLPANYEYSRNNTDNIPLLLQIQISGKVKIIFSFFIAFFESALNIENFSKKISLIAQVFLKLLAPKDVFT